MSEALIIIFLSTMAIGFVHTVIGPDHYVPLIAMAKARSWSLGKTLRVTLFCGAAHVLSAALLGAIAVAIGLSLTKLTFIENWRGSIAAWILIIFGLLYALWSFYKVHFIKTHKHHSHHTKDITAWVLILIFVLGPCEPLIPIMLYPAIQGSLLNVLWVTVLFSLTTIITMLAIVVLAVFGASLVKIPFLEKYGNTLAGAIICCSGVTIKLLGL
jgi:nickel/cobalt transporter (NicO) family protein